MSDIVYLLHGFNVKDGGNDTINKLSGPFYAAGYIVRTIQYGHIGRFGVRTCNDNIADVIASTVEPGSTIVAHSNGAALVEMAAERGAIFKQAFLINPALDSDRYIKNCRNTTVYFSPTDFWTKVAAFIPLDRWGNMGCKGYTGRNRIGVNNINLDLLAGEPVGHSGIFETDERVRALYASIRSYMV